MRKCFADDSKICDCQPTAGRICEGIVALRKDAERYRWLRANGEPDAGMAYRQDWTASNYDAAIDAAMAAVV